MPCTGPDLVEPVGFAVSCSSIGCGQSPAPSSAGRASKNRSETSANAAAACGRTSSTVISLPSSVANRREGRLGEAAGGDPLRERRRVQVDVERIAVRGHPLGDVHADRGDLPRVRRSVYPDAGQSFDSRRFDLHGGERADQRLLKVPAVALDVLAVAGQVEDRVVDELPRPMVGRLPAAVCLEDLHLGAVGDVELPLLGPRPSVITGGCSRNRRPCPGSRLARRRPRASAGDPTPRGTRPAPGSARTPSGHALSLLGGDQVVRPLEVFPAHEDLGVGQGQCGSSAIPAARSVIC